MPAALDPSRDPHSGPCLDLSALDGLVDELTREFSGAARGPRIAELLATYAREEDDWRAMALFDERGYTRNLVVRDERYELLVLCWGVGHESPIHNHEGQDCWMAVLDGEIEEVRYPTPDEVLQAGPGAVQPRDSKTFGQGQVAFIRDDIALHLVRSGNASSPAVSLHLYAAPYDECNCYCPDTGQITRKKLVNYAVRGRVLPTP